MIATQKTAWMVNWNLPLASFTGLLSGVKNLIDFAVSSSDYEPPAFIFSSSIDVCRSKYKIICAQSYSLRVSVDSLVGEVVREVSLTDLTLAMGHGYGEAKAVAERIIESASRHTALRATIVRLGQITGGRNGSWNETDWFPAMVKSSITIGSLPQLQGVRTLRSYPLSTIY